MKDLYHSLSLSQAIESPVLLRAAISECKDVDIRIAAEEILLNEDRKQVYDNTLKTFDLIQQVQEILDRDPPVPKPRVPEVQPAASSRAASGPARPTEPVKSAASQPQRGAAGSASASRPKSKASKLRKPTPRVKSQTQLEIEKFAKMCGWIALAAAIVFAVIVYFPRPKPLETGVFLDFEPSSISQRTAKVWFREAQHASYYIEFYAHEDGRPVLDVTIRQGDPLAEPILLVPGQYRVRITAGKSVDWKPWHYKFDPKLGSFDLPEVFELKESSGKTIPEPKLIVR